MSLFAARSWDLATRRRSIAGCAACGGRYTFKPAPYPTTKYWPAILCEEAGREHDAMITDLFERITLLGARARNAEVAHRVGGKWEFEFAIEAHTLVAVDKGWGHKEQLAGRNRIFTEQPGEKDFGKDSVLLFQRRAVHSGAQEWPLVLDGEPKWAGIDPYNMRIDRNAENNLVKVTGPERPRSDLAM
jgi:ABC-2 type transport system permease protein